MSEHLRQMWRRTAMPMSWRPLADSNFVHEHDCVIITEKAGRRRRYEVYCYGIAFANYDRLDEAKAGVEAVYGPLPWRTISMPLVEAVHYYFGPTTEFTDPLTIHVVDSLPRLGSRVARWQDDARISRVVEEVPTAWLAQFREYDRDPTTERFTTLRDSIAAEGIREPLLLEVSVLDGRAELTEGNHRLKVAEELGLPTVPVRVLTRRRLGDDGVPVEVKPGIGDGWDLKPSEALVRVGRRMASKVWVDCLRCGGSGSYGGGVCFRCRGAKGGWASEESLRRADERHQQEQAERIERERALVQTSEQHYAEFEDRYPEHWAWAESGRWSAGTPQETAIGFIQRGDYDGAKRFIEQVSGWVFEALKTAFRQNLDWQVIDPRPEYQTIQTVYLGLRFMLQGSDATYVDSNWGKQKRGGWALQILEPGDTVQLGVPHHHKFDDEADETLTWRDREVRSHFDTLAEAKAYIEDWIIGKGMVDQMVPRDSFPPGSKRYHLTLARHVPSILSQGLHPRAQVGTGSSVFGDLTKATTILWDLKNEDWAVHQGDPIALLELDVGGLLRSTVRNLSNEERVNEVVPPNRIKVVVPNIPWYLTESRFGGWGMSEAEILALLKGDIAAARKAWSGSPEELDALLGLA